MIADIIVRETRKRVQEKIAALSQRVTVGRVQDWAEYRQCVGEIRGNQSALSELANVVKNYEELSENDIED